MNTALGGGMSSRLFQEVREKRGLAYTVYSYHSQYTEAGLFSAYAGTTPSRAQEVVSLIRRELELVRDGGLTEEEFERAKGHVKGSIVLSLEDPGGRMSRLGQVRDRPRRDPLGRPDAASHRPRDARRCASRRRAGTVAADDAHGARPLPASAFREVMA